MDLTAFVTHARDHYVKQFEVFVQAQRQACTRGASEVKMRLGEKSEIFRHLYCVDFVKNDGKTEIVELQPKHVLTFDPVSVSFSGAALSIERLRWDDVVIHHNLTTIPADELERWFDQWFDPDDRHRSEAQASGFIHSLLVRPAVLSIDFGTSAHGALLDMLQILERGGATAIRVSSSIADASSVR
jgi:hypothetical protein